MKGDSRVEPRDDVVIGVDVGGTNIRAAALDHHLAKVAQAQRPMDKSSPATLLEGIAACVAGVVHASDRPAGIGVAMKGLVDHESGVMVSSSSLGMDDLPVRSFLEERFGLPAALDNDVHAATIGEIYYGAGRQYRDFIYLNVGTGIAAGLVSNGRLHRGVANMSGEFGHNTPDRHGSPCGCGSWGCLEPHSAGPGIAARAQEGLAAQPDSALASLAAGRLNATEVFQAAEQGDDLARRVVQETVEHLGTGVVNLVNMLNPAAIILGGGVFSGADRFVVALREFILSHAMDRLAASIREIRPSALGVNDVGLIGGASLIWEYRDLYHTHRTVI